MSLISPRTAQEMYDYCELHNLGTGLMKGWTLKHFGMIAATLEPDEKILTVFVGFHNYKTISQHDNNYAYAITNKRFILAQKRLIGGTLQTISLQNINDITLHKKLVNHFITVDTIKETFNVNVSDAKTADNIHVAIQEALAKAKSGAVISNRGSNMADQLFELKKLLDAGIITKRDFEEKKKQILGL